MVDKAERYVTSEEKLLKLIRHKDHAQKQKILKEAKSVPLSVRDASAGLNAFSQDWLTLLNKALMAAVAGLAIFLMVKAVILLPAPAMLPEVADETAAPAPAMDPGRDKPLEHYLSAVQKRDMFDASAAPGASSATENLPAAIAADDPRHAFRLVGIVMDNDPQVIIEDLRSRETHFLSAGQKIQQFTVETISESNVTLSGNGKTYELSNE